MKQTITFTLILLFTSGIFAQTPILTKAEVKAVKVYRNSAELQNTASISVSKGMSEVVVGNISEEIDKKSLQIGTGNKNITILSSQFTNDYVADFELDPTNPRIKQVGDSIKIVEQLISQSMIEADANTKAIELLDNNQTVLVGGNTSSVAQLSELTEYYTKKRIAISTKLVAIKKNTQVLQKKLTQLKSSLKTNEEKQAEEFASGVLVVKLMSDSATKVSLNINYLTYGVSWEPMYRIKGSSVSEPLNVTLKAVVKQNTGLDWKAVNLSLINGIPSRNNVAPTLEPWFLHAQNENQMKARAMVTANDVLNEVVVTENSVGFAINSNQLNESYNVDIPYDILTNGEEHLINLYQQEIPAEYEYFSAPNYNKEAFLVAKIDAFSQYDFVDAPASIIFENMYIGETRINPDQTEDKINITLGNDRRISINREDVKDKSGEKFLSSYKEKTITYDLVVKNNKKETVDIKIKDRIPLSTDESVTVELLESDKAKIDAEKGFLIWKLKLSPSKTKKLRVSYKVKFPKDYIIHNW